MAQIVLGLGTSHSPQLNTTIDWWPEHAKRDRMNSKLYDIDGQVRSFDAIAAKADPAIKKQLNEATWQRKYDACQQGVERLSEVYNKVKPDVLVIVGDDQEELFHDDLMPALTVYWGDTIMNTPRHYNDRVPPSIRAGGWAYSFDDDTKTVPVADALGLHIIETFVDEGFDTAHSKFLKDGKGMGHAFGFVYRRIMGDGNFVPTVPIMLNTYYPPNQPTPARCYQLGKTIKQAIQSWDSDLRVGVVASGGLSHFVIDEELDQMVLGAMERHDGEALSSLPRARLNSGTSEIRNWIVAAAVADDLDYKLYDYIPCHRSEAGTGCAMAFASWT